jgi:hypothetical protein
MKLENLPIAWTDLWGAGHHAEANLDFHNHLFVYCPSLASGVSAAASSSPSAGTIGSSSVAAGISVAGASTTGSGVFSCSASFCGQPAKVKLRTTKAQARNNFLFFTILIHLPLSHDNTLPLNRATSLIASPEMKGNIIAGQTCFYVNPATNDPLSKTGPAYWSLTDNAFLFSLILSISR